MASGSTIITIQMNTTIDGVNRSIPAVSTTITHAATGFIMGSVATSDTAAVIPQGGVIPEYAVFTNLSATDGEYIDVMNDAAVLTRIDPGRTVALDVSQVVTPASNLKAKAANGKTPMLSYYITAN